MKKYKADLGRDFNLSESSFIDRLSKESWVYMTTIINIVREPVLILDKDLKVLATNDSFCQMFQVEQKDTENKVIYELGNGQWNIPALRKLLDDILPNNTFFKDFEVIHEFPFIGQKSMVLNARRIDSITGLFLPIILVAIEDHTPMMAVADVLADHVKKLVAKDSARTWKLETYIDKLEKEIIEIKKKI